MPRMLSATRLLISAALCGVVASSAGPALAAEGPAVEARFGVARIATWAERETAKQHHLATAGPFAPLVGRPDYGTAENAFGATRSGHVHSGQDMFAAPGTPLVAVSDGVVADAGSDGGQGNYVHLYDPKRDRTYVYMHMIGPAAVSTGERVGAGERLGGVGCSGSCWGDHLHFELRDGKGMTGTARDPLPALRDWEPLSRPR